MASYHCRMKTAQASAVDHSQYLEREGKYEKIAEERGEEVIRGHGNMPEWAETPKQFWEASEKYERANANHYREIEVAIPKELTKDEMERTVKDYCREQFGDKHAFEYALHLDKQNHNPHAHIQFSEKINDGIKRSEEQYFKQANKKAPERGGCVKSREWQAKGRKPSERLLQAREGWAKHCNQALERAQVEARVDHRSLKAQGIERTPEIHTGYRDPARPEIHAARIERNEAIKAGNREPGLRQQLVSSAKEAQDATRSLRAAKRAHAQLRAQAQARAEKRAQEAARNQPSAETLTKLDRALAAAAKNVVLDDKPRALAGVASKARVYAQAEQAFGQTKAKVDRMTGIDRRFGDQELTKLGQARDLAKTDFRDTAQEAVTRHGREAVKEAVEKALGPQAKVALDAARIVTPTKSQGYSRG